MKICAKLKSIFKPASKSPEVLKREMMQDLMNVRFSEDSFTKKYRKRRDQDIKKIPSLTEVEKDQRIELATIFDDLNKEVLNFTPLIKRKYEIAHRYMEDYLDALRKSIKKV